MHQLKINETQIGLKNIDPSIKEKQTQIMQKNTYPSIKMKLELD